MWLNDDYSHSPFFRVMLYYGSWLASNGFMGATSPPPNISSCVGGFRYAQETLEKIIIPIMVTRGLEPSTAWAPFLYPYHGDSGA